MKIVSLTKGIIKCLYVINVIIHDKASLISGDVHI